MNKLELLRTFVRVSELSSFTLAGESLAAALDVSEHVQALEACSARACCNAPRARCRRRRTVWCLYERSKDLLSHMDEIEGCFARIRRR
jgi:hypothetical protein